ncbi:MAG: archaemetzincin family Zn-dependent metalloprotease [Candidatus Verstraetearchaeota archaeon]|nr:archaemetzincin family Zn-dependent metalloprotease [Candidatus Verstraetearchaeota archaeon]
MRSLVIGAKVKVVLQPLEPVESDVVYGISSRLNELFKVFEFSISRRHLELPRHAFNEGRRQYNSSAILDELVRLYERGFFGGCQRVVGVADVDAYVLGLNFVFGEALLGGPVAAVYLARLRPEFYGKAPNWELFLERACKEVVHELGHTFGLRHCSNPKCVMHFSNTIFDTDFKDVLYCLRCQSALMRALIT